MVYDEFFTDSDKPYAENLNDSLMLLDAFDVTVPCSMPDMFNNGDFSSSVNVTRKCGVALVTLKSVDSGVTVGTSSISGTGSVVFRVYPNFNSFYKWSKIILEKSGTVAIGFKKADGTDITVTVASDGTIGDAAALKMLEEIDVVLTLDNASISNILIWFVNNQGERVRTSALLEAEQLVNVDGAVVDNDLRAVSGDTVKGALDSFETDVVDEKIGDLSDSVDGKLSDLSDNVDSKLTNGLALKENLSNKVTSLDNSNAHYPTTSAIQPLITAIEGLVDITFTPKTEVYSNKYFYDRSEIQSNLSGVTLKIICTSLNQVTTSIPSKQKYTLYQLFGTGLISLPTNRNFRIQIVSSISNNVLFDKTYDKDGNVVG